MEEKFLTHSFGPFYDEESCYLFLGSFPSVKSREAMFYYGHPQNRFWKVMLGVFGDEADILPQSVEEKKLFLSKHHVALYDVIESCRIKGSSDSSIRDVTVTDLAPILADSRIGERIFVNGGKAYELYMKYTFGKIGIKPVKLPSTSPANAAWGLDRLVEKWREEIMLRGA